MKKFKIKYYELVMNEHEEQFEQVKEEEVHAASFFCNDGVFFTNDFNEHVAYYSRVISVKEVQ